MQSPYPHGDRVTAPYLLDCDTGIDDALAIAWLASHAEVELVAVTSVFGNVDALQAAQNSCDLLEMLGQPSVPVIVGAQVTLTGDETHSVPYIHGHNGIGDVQLPRAAHGPITTETAAEAIVRLAREHAGELRVVAIGPLTNLALALQLEPDLPTLLSTVTVMGGSALAPGNTSAMTEANIANDQDAAAVVFAAGFDLTVVGLDVTMQNLLDETHRVRLLVASSPVARALGEMLPIYFEFYRTVVFGRPVCAMHDPLAAAIATGDIVPTVAPRVRGFVDLAPGPERGQTIYDLRGRYRAYDRESPEANIRLVMECGTDFADVLTTRLEQL